MFSTKNEEEIRRRMGKKLEILAKIYTPEKICNNDPEYPNLDPVIDGKILILFRWKGHTFRPQQNLQETLIITQERKMAFRGTTHVLFGKMSS